MILILASISQTLVDICSFTLFRSFFGDLTWKTTIFVNSLRAFFRRNIHRKIERKHSS